MVKKTSAGLGFREYHFINWDKLQLGKIIAINREGFKKPVDWTTLFKICFELTFLAPKLFQTESNSWNAASLLLIIMKIGSDGLIEKFIGIYFLTLNGVLRRVLAHLNPLQIFLMKFVF